MSRVHSGDAASGDGSLLEDVASENAELAYWEQPAILHFPEEAAERLADGAQALQLAGYARPHLDDIVQCLRISRLLLVDTSGRYQQEVAAALECASNVASMFQYGTATADRINKLDHEAAHYPQRLLKLTADFVAFFAALLAHMVNVDLTKTTLESQALGQATGAMCITLWPTSDLHTAYLMPEVLAHIADQAFINRLAVTCRGTPVEGCAAEQLTFDHLATHTLQALLTDLFITLGGLHRLGEVISKIDVSNLGALLHFLQLISTMDQDVLAAASGPDARVLWTHEHARYLDQVLQGVGVHMLQVIQEDPEPLAERERSFTSLNRTFDLLVSARCALGQNTPDVRIAVDKEVTAMQRCFVLRMLRSTNFNNLLSAARECQNMLWRATEMMLVVDDGAALRSADAWLNEHGVITTLLKANLHQRQYADLVLGILSVLTRFNLIRSEHLDQLWAVTEAEGTFDVVKANVYAMIQALAGDLDDVLLEQLFAKFEVLVGSRSVADSMRLLDLIKKLATSTSALPKAPETTSVAAERLLALIWKLTMPVDAPPELLACDAMADVLRQYGGTGHRLYLKQYLGRCCQELAARTNVLTALRTLRRLLALYDCFDAEQDKASQEAARGEAGTSGASTGGPPGQLLPQVLAELDAEHGLQRLLLDCTLHLMRAARAAGVARASGGCSGAGGDLLLGGAERAGSGALGSPRASLAGVGALPGVASPGPTGMRVPGYGSQPYNALLSEHVQTITYVASKQQAYYQQEWSEVLFDALVVRPVTPVDAELGLQFLLDGSSPDYGEFLSKSTQAALLTARLTALPTAPLSPMAWSVFHQYFLKVNGEAGLLQVHGKGVDEGPGSLDASSLFGLRGPSGGGVQLLVPSVGALHGLPFIWHAALSADHPHVAQQAADLLIQVYIQGTRDTPNEADAHATFIHTCTGGCMKAVPRGQLPGDAAGAEPATPVTPVTPVAQQAPMEFDNQPSPSDLAPPPPSQLPDHAAVRYVQRCLLLLYQAADRGQLATLPLVPSHQSSFQTMPWDVDWQYPSSVKGANNRRARLPACPNDYVGTVRRAIAAELGSPPQNVRLLLAGSEWKQDSHVLRQVLHRTEVPGGRQLLHVAVSPVANSYTQPSPGYTERWQTTPLALLAKEPHMHTLLVQLADHTEWHELSGHAARLLQLLPTDPSVPTALSAALRQSAHPAVASLRALLLDLPFAPATPTVAGEAGHEEAAPGVGVPTAGGMGEAGWRLAPARLTYWLQALHALLFPSASMLATAGDTPGPTTGKAAGGHGHADPAGLLRSLAACMGVLQEVLHAAVSVARGDDSHPQRLHQVLELHSQLVQLLYSLSRRDAMAVLHTHRAGGGSSWRPAQLDLLLCSPGDSPMCAGATAAAGQLTPSTLGTPTGALQALSMIGSDREVDGESSGGDASAAVVVHAAAVPETVMPEASLAPVSEPGDAAMAEDAEPSASGGAAVAPARASCADAGRGADGSPGTGPVVPATTQHVLPPASQPRHPAVKASPGVSEPSPAALVVGLLVQACWQACHIATGAVTDSSQQRAQGPDASHLGAGLSPGPLQAAPCLMEAQQVVRDGLTTLSKLLHTNPELYPAFLANPTSALLVSDVLLMPHSAVVRGVAARALRDICLTPPGGASSPVLGPAYTWLLRQLVTTRPTALQCTADNREYLSLLTDVVEALPRVPDAQLSPNATSVAAQLLHDEMDSLHDTFGPLLFPDLSTPESTLEWQLEGAAVASDAGQAELAGRLQVLMLLLRVLGRSSEPSSDLGDLIELVVTRLLFPEAHLYPDVRSGVAQPPQMQAIFTFCAHDAQARAYVYDLLLELLPGSALCFAWGTRRLTELHYHRAPLALEKLQERKGEGVEPLRPPGGYCGLRNGGATCYMNAVIQQLFMQPRVRANVLAGLPVSPEEVADSMYAQLQWLLATLSLSCQGSVHPRPFWESCKDYDGQPVDVKEHQDASEFFVRLQDAVDSTMKAQGQAPALSSVFGGRFVFQILSRETSHRSEREEPFDQVSVDVKGKGTLQNSLASYVQGELLEGDNAWFCEELGRKVPATRRAAFKSLPSTLIIHLKRFEYDHIMNQRYKVRERFEFPQVLDMYPYTVEGLAAADALAAGTAAPPAAGGDEDMRLAGASEGGAVQRQASDATMADASSDVSSPGGAPSRCLYQLRGVVVHSGSAFAGHYYSFIQERPHTSAPGVEGRWFSFDDRFVQPWDVSRLDEQCFGGPPPLPAPGEAGANGRNSGPPADRAYSAFMLFYDRVGSQDALEVDPVPSYLPPACVPGFRPPAATTVPPAAANAATAVEGTAVQAGGAVAGAVPATAAESAQGAQQPEEVAAAGPDAAAVAPPYGMSPVLHRRTLTDNLLLLRRMRGLDKDYCLFVRKMCEARLDRVTAGKRKVRRTRHLAEPEHSPRGSAGEPAGDNTGDAGTTAAHVPSPGSGGAGASAGAMQDASSRRDADRVSTAADVAALGVDFVLNVVMQAPVAVMQQELEPWLQLLQKLMAQGWQVCARVVDILTATDQQLRRVIDTLVNIYQNRWETARVWMERLVDALQQHLVACSNLAVARVFAAHAEETYEESDVLKWLEACEPVAAHARLLRLLAVQPLKHHHVHCAEVFCKERLAMLRAAGRRQSQAQRLLWDKWRDNAVFCGYGACFRMLATMLWLDAPAQLLLVESDWAFTVLAALHAMCTYATEFRDSQCIDDFQLELAGPLASCVGLILIKLNHHEQVFSLDQRSGAVLEGGPLPDPAHFCARFAAAARLPQRLPSPVDPGPAPDMAPYVTVMDSRPVTQIVDSLLSNGHAQDVIVSALFLPSVLRAPPTTTLLQLLCWNQRSFSSTVVNQLHGLIQGADLDTAYTEPDYLVTLCAVAPDLLVIHDALCDARVNAMLRAPEAQRTLQFSGLAAMLERGPALHKCAVWWVLGGACDLPRLAQIVQARGGAQGLAQLAMNPNADMGPPGTRGETSMLHLMMRTVRAMELEVFKHINDWPVWEHDCIMDLKKRTVQLMRAVHAWSGPFRELMARHARQQQQPASAPQEAEGEQAQAVGAQVEEPGQGDGSPVGEAQDHAPVEVVTVEELVEEEAASVEVTMEDEPEAGASQQ